MLVCATVAKAPRDGVDFLPLSVEFEEKLYSVGKIPGGFIKRGGPPVGKGGVDGPAHRPAAPSAVPEGVL